MRPDWVVFENVLGFRNTASGTFLRDVRASFKKLGYDCIDGVLDAFDYGVPQNRKRFFLVGSLHTKPAFPEPLPRRSTLTVEAALSDLPSLSNGAQHDWLPYPRKPRHAYARELRDDSKGCANHYVSWNSKLVIDRYSHVPQGGNWENIPDRLMSNYSNKLRCHTGIYHRLQSDAPSVVIGNYRKNMLIHPHEDRGLSVREAARLQSFPDSFLFTGSIGFQQQQVGNAIPPKLAQSVFHRIRTAN